tara:strand:- start:1786 stop:2781 length:996 start_codon:yes stop_codon:yes gene_type:complete
MASSYSSDLKLELMATGENAGTWGDKTNTNLNLVQQAIGGFEQVTVGDGATVALAMSDGAISNARNMVIKVATVTLSGATVLTVPNSIEKMYIFDVTGVTNPTNLTIKTASGTGFSPDQQKIYFAYADGTNIVEISLDSLGGAVGSASLPTVPVTKGGTGLTSAGSANQALKMNSGGSAVEFGTLAIAGGGTGATTLAGANIAVLNATNNFGDNILQRSLLKDTGEVRVALGDLGGGTDDIDLSLGNVFTATVSTGTQTLTFSNPSPSGNACTFMLILTNGGSQTVNFPASVDFPGGTAPTLTTSGVDILMFTTIDGGTIYHGLAASTDSK